MSTSIRKSVVLRRLVGVVATLALALGIAGVGTAEASTTVWDKVAACESSGNWQINTGNGYYGGLQFSSRTWRGFGGGVYASQANRATKSQQIAIARRVLAGQGAGAWPVCGRRANLTRSNGKADAHATPATNPGQTSAPSPARKSTPTSKTIRVKSGDTLVKIAARYSVRGGWRGLWNLNKSTVKNPNRIRVGQVLKIA